MKEIYLDNAATTRCDPGAAQVALEMMTEEYGNPSSLHQKGIRAQVRLEEARNQAAAAMGCAAAEVVFTASGTEANNLAVMGAAMARKRRGREIVALSTLHASLLRPLKGLSEQDFLVRLVDPLEDGRVDLDAMLEAVTGETALLVLEYVNGEVGAIHPVAEICRQARRKNKDIFIHCDAVQAFGKVPFAAHRLGVDALSVSGHKIYGPKGCGALYLRKGTRIVPLLAGGGQERGLRSGTENTPAICAFGYVAGKATAQRSERLARVEGIREYFVNKAEKVSGICMNSPPDSTPYISNLSVAGLRGETLVHFLAQRGIYVSSGSACSKGAASPVLTAMGLSRRRVEGALRISLSPHNVKEDIDAFFAALEDGMNTLAGSGS